MHAASCSLNLLQVIKTLECIKKELCIVESNELEKFVKEASQLSFAMLTVNPPMLPDTSEDTLNDDTQILKSYGVEKEIEDSVDCEDSRCTVMFFKPVLYENYLRDIPLQKGWTGVKEVYTNHLL